ncbi:MAG TPA: shikimate kinase [Planctomycetota bacterium]|jgi:shikimate kinase|nr:shikimate kinase [Planctomycetota bacterium]
MPRLTLIGYRACGKSTLGPLAAARLGWAFCDLDHAITIRIGMPIAAYFSARGESAFRAAESSELRTTLEKPGNLVLATGGGCVLREENRGFLRASGGICVYLAVPAAILQERLRRDTGGRPSLTGGSVADEVERVLTIREPLYRAVADVVLDGTRPIAALVDDLISLVENPGGKSPAR